MEFSEIIFRKEWSYENTEREVCFRGGLIPGRLSFIKIGGRVEREDVPPIARCMKDLYGSGLIDDSRIVRVVDFTTVCRLLKYPRREYASLLSRLNREHRCEPLVTYLCGGSRAERNQIRMFALFVRQRYVFVETVEEAFERIAGDAEVTKPEAPPSDDDVVLKPHHLQELNSQVGALLFGPSVFKPELGVSADNPVKSAIESLTVAQKDLNQLQDLEALSDAKIEDTVLQNKELIEQIPVQLWSLQDEQNYGIVNRSYAQFHGLNPQEMAFQDFFDLFPAERAQQYRDGNTTVFKTGEISETEEWFTNAAGEDRFMRVCKVPRLDPLGNVESVVCSATDITDLKNAEADILKTKNTYQDILNSVSEAIYVVSKKGVFLRVNRGAERMYQYSQDELLGKDTSFVSAPGKNDIRGVKRKLFRVYRTGEPTQFEFWGRRKSGEIFPKAIIAHKGSHFGEDVIILTARDITEETQNRKALQEAEEKYRLIVETTSDAIIIVGANQRILFANDTIERMAGYQKETLLGHSCDRFFAHRISERLELDDHDARSGGEVTRFRTRLGCSDGSELDVDLVGKSLDYQGESAVLITIRDVSEQVRAERSHQHQFELRQLLMELSSTFINLPLSEVEMAVNQSLRRLSDFVGADRGYIFDYDFDRNTTSNTFEYCRDGVEPQIDNLQDLSLETLVEWRDTHRQGETIEIPYVQTLPPGGTRDVLEPQAIKSLLAVPLMEGKTCVGFVGFDYVSHQHSFSGDEKEMIRVFARMLVDVKRRVFAEETRAKLSKAIEQSPTSVEITNAEGIIEYVNPGLCATMGYRRDELLGKNPSIYRSGHHDEAFFEEMWQKLINGEVWRGEILNKRKNGELLWEYTIISPVARKDGQITHFVAVKEDITARREMIEQLQMAKEQAEESDRLKSAFLANMSHEIRTPLNGIIGFASLLREDAESDEVKGYAEIINRSGEHLLNIINDIIHISKLDAGHIEMVPDVCNISSLLSELKTLFEELVAKEKRPIELVLEAPTKDLWAVTDLTRLRQILENLLGNAVKFTSAGSIHFGCEVADGSLLFHVRDTGIGIPLEKQKMIFERFVQASSRTERMFGGTGLGLAISKACAEMLGGHIWVESSEGKGSAFYFNIHYMPCSDPNQPETAGAELPGFEGKHVLVVDDDDLSFLFLERMCASRGIRVTRAASGLQAVQFLGQHRTVDLVLMDIRMPEMDGWEATRAIRKRHRHLPIIAQTAYAFENDEEKSLEAGCNEYLSKPISVECLFRTLARYL